MQLLSASERNARSIPTIERLKNAITRHGRFGRDVQSQGNDKYARLFTLAVQHID